MKVALLSLSAVVFFMGCGGDDGTDKPANTAGSPSGGAGGAGAGAGGMVSAGGMVGNGGQSGGTAGNATSGAGTGGAAGGASGGNGGNGGASGGAGGGGSKGFECPATTEAPKLTGLTPTKVMGVPPADDFNHMNNDATNIEGAVWLGNALYVSEINYSNAPANMPPPSRVLKITADDQVSVAIMPDSGTNGLAVNAAGELFFSRRYVELDAYLFRGEMRGIMTRLSATTLSNVHAGAGTVPTFVIEDA